MSKAVRKFRQQDDYPECLGPGEGAISFDLSEDRCRHEFGPDVHMANILARNPVIPGRAEYGVQETNPDLTLAMDLGRRAQHLYEELPQGVRAKYPTWKMFWDALQRGEVEVQEKAPAGPEVSSGPGGASASDSAPGGA